MQNPKDYTNPPEGLGAIDPKLILKIYETLNDPKSLPAIQKMVEDLEVLDDTIPNRVKNLLPPDWITEIFEKNVHSLKEKLAKGDMEGISEVYNEMTTQFTTGFPQNNPVFYQEVMENFKQLVRSVVQNPLIATGTNYPVVGLEKLLEERLTINLPDLNSPNWSMEELSQKIMENVRVSLDSYKFFGNLVEGRADIVKSVEVLVQHLNERFLSVPRFDLYYKRLQPLWQHSFNPGTPWPTAELSNGDKLKLVPAELDSRKQPEPERIRALSEKMQRQGQALSDLDADVLDMLCHVWTHQATSNSHYAVVKIDELLTLQGRTPKQSGQYKGGYDPEQRQEITEAINRIGNLWLDVTTPGSGALNRQRIQTRAFVITDRRGASRADGELDIQVISFLPGKILANYLYGDVQGRAFLPVKVIQYNPYHQRWEKRLGRVFSYFWNNGFEQKYTPQKLLEIIGETSRVRYSARIRERLEKALDTLQMDGIIANWQYLGWDEKVAEKSGWYWVWLETPLVLTAPASIQKLYQNESVGTAKVDIKPALSEQVREKRKELGLSQEEAAQALGFSQSYYSKLERNQVELSPDYLQKVERWLDDMPHTQE